MRFFKRSKCIICLALATLLFLVDGGVVEAAAVTWENSKVEKAPDESATSRGIKQTLTYDMKSKAVPNNESASTSTAGTSKTETAFVGRKWTVTLKSVFTSSVYTYNNNTYTQTDNLKFFDWYIEGTNIASGKAGFYQSGAELLNMSSTHEAQLTATAQYVPVSIFKTANTQAVSGTNQGAGNITYNTKTDWTTNLYKRSSLDTTASSKDTYLTASSTGKDDFVQKIPGYTFLGWEISSKSGIRESTTSNISFQRTSDNNKRNDTIYSDSTVTVLEGANADGSLKTSNHTLIRYMEVVPHNQAFDVSLVPVFTANMYQVKFDVDTRRPSTNGGTTKIDYTWNGVTTRSKDAYYVRYNENMGISYSASQNTSKSGNSSIGTASSNSVLTKNSAGALRLPQPVITGYRFVGWVIKDSLKGNAGSKYYLKNDGSETLESLVQNGVITIDSLNTGGITLIAEWEPRTYEVWWGSSSYRTYMGDGMAAVRSPLSVVTVQYVKSAEYDNSSGLKFGGYGAVREVMHYNDMFDGNPNDPHKAYDNQKAFHNVGSTEYTVKSEDTNYLNTNMYGRNFRVTFSTGSYTGVAGTTKGVSGRLKFLGWNIENNGKYADDAVLGKNLITPAGVTSDGTKHDVTWNNGSSSVASTSDPSDLGKIRQGSIVYATELWNDASLFKGYVSTANANLKAGNYNPVTTNKNLTDSGTTNDVWEARPIYSHWLVNGTLITRSNQDGALDGKGDYYNGDTTEYVNRLSKKGYTFIGWELVGGVSAYNNNTDKSVDFTTKQIVTSDGFGTVSHDIITGIRIRPDYVSDLRVGYSYKDVDIQLKAVFIPNVYKIHFDVKAGIPDGATGKVTDIGNGLAIKPYTVTEENGNVVRIDNYYVRYAEQVGNNYSVNTDNDDLPINTPGVNGGLPRLDLEGWTFEYWYYKKPDGTEVPVYNGNSLESLGITSEDLTLIPKFVAMNYDVQYNRNTSDTGVGSNGTVVSGEGNTYWGNATGDSSKNTGHTEANTTQTMTYDTASNIGHGTAMRKEYTATFNVNGGTAVNGMSTDTKTQVWTWQDWMYDPSLSYLGSNDINRTTLMKNMTSDKNEVSKNETVLQGYKVIASYGYMNGYSAGGSYRPNNYGLVSSPVRVGNTTAVGAINTTGTYGSVAQNYVYTFSGKTRDGVRVTNFWYNQKNSEATQYPIDARSGSYQQHSAYINNAVFHGGETVKNMLVPQKYWTDKPRQLDSVIEQTWHQNPTQNYAEHQTVRLFGRWRPQGVVTLPDMERDGYIFLGWYTVAQGDKDDKWSNDWVSDGSSPNGTVAPYKYGSSKYANYFVGLGGTDIVLDNNVTLYAWWNAMPKFVDVYDGQFFEGQNVSFADLMSLVAAFDIEDDYQNTALRTLYDLPEVDEADIWLEVIQADNTGKIPKVIGDELYLTDGTTVKGNWYIEKDGKLVFNSDAVPAGKTPVYIGDETDGYGDNGDSTGYNGMYDDPNRPTEGTVNNDNEAIYEGILYRLKDGWTKVSGVTFNEVDITGNVYQYGGQKYFTTAMKMKLEEQLNASSLVQSIYSIKYECDGGVSRGDGVYNAVYPYWGTPYQFKKVPWVSAHNGDADAVRELETRYIDTGTGRINLKNLANVDETKPIGEQVYGKFYVTYAVTDLGIYVMEKDGAGWVRARIPNSQTTMYYTRECTIQYNAYPRMYMRDMTVLDGVNDDIDSDAIKAQQIALDSEDAVNNPPWWLSRDFGTLASGNLRDPLYPDGVGFVHTDIKTLWKSFSFDRLQRYITEKSVTSVILYSQIQKDYPSLQSDINKWLSDYYVQVKHIVALKGNNDPWYGDSDTFQVYARNSEGEYEVFTVTGNAEASALTGKDVLTKNDVYESIQTYGVGFNTEDQFGKMADGTTTKRHIYRFIEQFIPDTDPNKPPVVDVDEKRPVDEDGDGIPDTYPDGTPKYEPDPELGGRPWQPNKDTTIDEDLDGEPDKNPDGTPKIVPDMFDPDSANDDPFQKPKEPNPDYQPPIIPNPNFDPTLPEDPVENPKDIPNPEYAPDAPNKEPERNKPEKVPNPDFDPTKPESPENPKEIPNPEIPEKPKPPVDPNKPVDKDTDGDGIPDTPVTPGGNPPPDNDDYVIPVIIPEKIPDPKPIPPGSNPDDPVPKIPNPKYPPVPPGVVPPSEIINPVLDPDPEPWAKDPDDPPSPVDPPERDPDNPEPDPNPFKPSVVQPSDSREVVITKVSFDYDDDMMQANVRDRLRFIDYNWFNQNYLNESGNYYMGDGSSFGLDGYITGILGRILSKPMEDDLEKFLRNVYIGNYETKYGNEIDVIVNDYTK